MVTRQGKHPYPTENLGYDSKREVNIVTNSSLNPRRKNVKVSQSIAADSSIDHDHSYFSSLSSAYVEDDTQSSLLEECQEANVNVRGIFVKFLHVFMYLFAFMLISTILNFIYGFALSCRRKLALIQILRAQVMSLQEENGRLKRYIDSLEKKEKLCKCKLSLFEQLIKSDDDVLFYTRIPTRVYCTVCSSSVEREKGNIY